jgi:hypothetical protein
MSSWSAWNSRTWRMLERRRLGTGENITRSGLTAHWDMQRRTSSALPVINEMSINVVMFIDIIVFRFSLKTPISSGPKNGEQPRRLTGRKGLNLGRVHCLLEGSLGIEASSQECASQLDWWKNCTLKRGRSKSRPAPRKSVVAPRKGCDAKCQRPRCSPPGEPLSSRLFFFRVVWGVPFWKVPISDHYR